MMVIGDDDNASKIRMCDSYLMNKTSFKLIKSTQHIVKNMVRAYDKIHIFDSRYDIDDYALHKYIVYIQNNIDTIVNTFSALHSTKNVLLIGILSSK